jgi:hypothetical protein
VFCSIVHLHYWVVILKPVYVPFTCNCHGTFGANTSWLNSPFAKTYLHTSNLCNLSSSKSINPPLQNVKLACMLSPTSVLHWPWVPMLLFTYSAVIPPYSRFSIWPLPCTDYIYVPRNSGDNPRSHLCHEISTHWSSTQSTVRFIMDSTTSYFLLARCVFTWTFASI